MKKIKLTQDKYALVDNQDYDFLNQWKWHFNSGYAMRREYLKGGKGKSVYLLMHRVIMNTPRGLETDHINMDKLDNRRQNLRVCTRSQNGTNKNIQSNNTSGYKGVTWRKDRNKWKALIAGKSIGIFSSKTEAAKAYDGKARELYGEFAKLNFN